MPWWALPFDDASKRAALSTHFDVEGIPTLIVLSANGEKIINSNGTGALQTDPTGADFPWAARPVEKLSGNAIEHLNNGDKCFVLVTDDFTPAGVQRAEELMIDSALPQFMMDEPGAYFYIADSTFKLSRDLMSMIELGDASMPQLVMLELPKFAVGPLPKDSSTVAAFVTGCLSETVELQTLQ